MARERPDPTHKPTASGDPKAILPGEPTLADRLVASQGLVAIDLLRSLFGGKKLPRPTKP